MCLIPGTYWLYVKPTASFGFIVPVHCLPYVASVHCAPCPTGQTCTCAELSILILPTTVAASQTFNYPATIQSVVRSFKAPRRIKIGTPFRFHLARPVSASPPMSTAMILRATSPSVKDLTRPLPYMKRTARRLSGRINSGIGNDAQLTTACLTSGWYHIRVEGLQGSVGPYVLSLSCAPCACPPPCGYQNRDIEPANNTCATAPAEFCGDTLCGEIRQGPSPDVDWYLFFVFGPNCQQLTVDVFGNGTPGYYGYLAGLNPIVKLWNGTCTTQLALDDNSGIANDSRLVSACLQPGTYRLKITRSGGHCRTICPCGSMSKLQLFRPMSLSRC